MQADPRDRRPSVVVVTGASSGVGRATARAFAARGARLGLIARGADGLDRAADECRSLGTEAVAIPADVADPDAVERAAETAERELGPIDVWVNDAMVSVLSPVGDLRAEEVRRVTEVTYLGAVNGTLAALRRMARRDRGVILQVGSALAHRAIPLQAPYCAAKHALRAFSDSLRCELLHDRSRIRVVSVHLPAVNTPQFEVMRTRLPRHPQPVPPIFQPEVAARAIVWASERARREVWVGRSTWLTILGERVAPALLDRRLARTGYRSQQTDQPVAPDRRDNLDGPLPGDRGAHGIFDARAHHRSATLAARRHGLRVAAGLAAATAVLAAAVRGRA